MKFAKELEHDLVPEWRAKYLDYKEGKRKIKAISRAIRNVSSATPRTPLFRKAATPTSLANAPRYSFFNRAKPARTTGTASGLASADGLRGTAATDLAAKGSATPWSRQRISGASDEQPLRPGGDRYATGDAGASLTSYGSIIGSPQEDLSPVNQRHVLSKPPSFELPDPAISPHSKEQDQIAPVSRIQFDLPDRQGGGIPASMLEERDFSKQPGTPGISAYEAGLTRSSSHGKKIIASRHLSLFRPKRVSSSSAVDVKRPVMKRLMSLGAPVHPSPRGADVPLEAYRELDIRQAEFFQFLDLELEKIESFYGQKEDEATNRLKVLREQLHIMRDRRMEELVKARADRVKAKKNKSKSSDIDDSHSGDDDQRFEGRSPPNGSWLRAIENAVEAAKRNRFSRDTKAMQSLSTPAAPRPLDGYRDYVQRSERSTIPYRTAKRKLKIALQEYYRGLELLKSYALLNRTAFRKMNKKYDKAVNAWPSYRYMNDKVNEAYFVRSDMLEGHIRAVEDLYARYFESGNHKIAASKLRAKTIRPEDYTPSVFRNGALLAAAVILGVQGVIDASARLFSPDPVLATKTSYLLQLYAGYFLMLLLVLFFCGACKFWVKSKVNYVFVFEYDTRHHLDWRQLFEIPCFFFFLLGFFMWLNFSRYSGDAMYIYFPIVLICITAVVLFFPAPILYHRTRLWFLYANWRLFFAGLYPVEFRDFFLGDMFCSETYAMGNIELCFCLYTRNWSTPAACNSSHSRLLGFFTALPGIWRALQCVRRYYDTQNVFPHLVNCGKYSCTILYYVSLSLWRISKPNNHLKAFFIFCATTNAIYCTVWDLIMDWSLIDPTAKYPLLRETLAYKQVWIYYVAIMIDPILRFNWIFYAIFADDVQHSALLSFLVSLSEVFRRGIWVLFRVENEHCTNVGRFRASRDVPLPYDIKEQNPLLADAAAPGKARARFSRRSDEESILESTQIAPSAASTTPRTSGADLSGTTTRASPLIPSRSSTLRRRKQVEPSPLLRGLSRVGTLLHEAHAQDFERKRRPEVGKEEASSDEEEDDEDAKTMRSMAEEEGENNENDVADHMVVPDVECHWRCTTSGQPSAAGRRRATSGIAHASGDQEDAADSSGAMSPKQND